MEEELRDEMERRVAKEVEEGVTLWVQVLVSVAVMVVVATIGFKFVWAWVVPVESRRACGSTERLCSRNRRGCQTPVVIDGHRLHPQ